MMILTVTLYIALAGFANSTELGSPARLPKQVYIPKGPACSSGREFEEPTDIKVNNCHYDSKGLFYEENGKYYPVRPGIPLIEYENLIIGRYSNGLVAPVFNSKREYVLAYPLALNLQFILDEEDRLVTQKQYQFGQPMPPDSRVVNLLVSHEPEVEKLPHDREVNCKPSVPSKKSRKSGKRHFK